MDKLKKFIDSAITGLDAIQRAPIVNVKTDLRCLRIGDISQNKSFLSWGYTSADINEVKSFLIKNDDVFIARTGSTIGCSFYANECYKAVFNNGIIRLRTNNLMLPRFLSYLIKTDSFRKYVSNVGMASATQPNIKIIDMLDYDVLIPNIEYQQHIVNTIGTVDDLIENYQAQISKLYKIGLTKINCLNDKFDTGEFNHIAELKKGYEAGSSNYLETESKDSIHYIRVGDLESISNTFVIINDEMPVAKEDDILVAFDGAPGRNAIGLNGVYSSGIYKVKCSSQHKGLAYFELNSNTNQRIISNHSQGTTILHASKAIPFLISIKDNNYCGYFNKIFNDIVNLKKKINLLKKQKNLLLDRYFTSQQ